MLVIDLLPPTRRDPQGIHKAIWDEIDDEPVRVAARQTAHIGVVFGRNREGRLR